MGMRILPERVKTFDNIVKQYTKELRSDFNQKEFKEFLDRWYWWLDPPVQKLLANPLSSHEFKMLMKGLKKERSGVPAITDMPPELYSILLSLTIPKIMLEVQHLVLALHLPFGAVFKKLVEMGYIEIKDHKIIPNFS